MKSYFYVIFLFCVSIRADFNNVFLFLHDQLNILNQAFQATIPSESLEIPQEYIVVTSQYNKYPLTQLKVVDQFSPGGGGGASCGYHGLKNGLYIALSLSAFVEKKPWIEHLKNLTSFTIVADLFGSAESLWRKAIIRLRGSKDTNYGEWLDNNEIEFLIKNQIQRPLDTIEKLPHFSFIAVPDISTFINPRLEYERVNKLLKAFHDPQSSFIQVIVLGDMTQRGDDPTKESPGHWITLVIFKRESNVHFFVTNSARNTNSLEYAYVRNLLQFITTENDRTFEEKNFLLEMLETQINNVTNYILGNITLNELQTTNQLLMSMQDKNEEILNFINAVKPFLSEQWQFRITLEHLNHLINHIRTIKRNVIYGFRYNPAEDDFDTILYLKFLHIIFSQKAGLIVPNPVLLTQENQIKDIMSNRQKEYAKKRTLMEKAAALQEFLKYYNELLILLTPALSGDKKQEMAEHLRLRIQEFQNI